MKFKTSEEIEQINNTIKAELICIGAMALVIVIIAITCAILFPRSL